MSEDEFSTMGSEVTTGPGRSADELCLRNAPFQCPRSSRQSLASIHGVELGEQTATGVHPAAAWPHD